MAATVSSSPFRVPTGPATASIEVKKSRFLAEAFPVSSQEEARAILKAQKGKYPDARHVVHAFAVGETGGILGCSDDGEPSGTAGRPVLEVLKGSRLTNSLVTVTRWFGGTLLGTGGLVKAYTEAAKAVLAATESVELVQMKTFTVPLSYELYERVKRLLETLGAELTGERFETTVVLEGRIRAELADTLSAAVTELTSGRCAVLFGD